MSRIDDIREWLPNMPLAKDRKNMKYLLEELDRVTKERDVAIMALREMRFAYLNKDAENPHQH